jgi:phosphoribosylanthranilate isomerase
MTIGGDSVRADGRQLGFMTWVKICGMTNLEDALVAVEAGADAVGFVFYERSPRYVTVERAREICEKLPNSVEKVGVFVGSSQAAEMALAAGVDAMQSYIVVNSVQPSLGENPPEFRKLRQYLAISYSTLLKTSFPEQRSAPMSRLADAWFIDSGGAQSPGGTGATFNWKEAVPALESLAQQMRIVIAGGLNAQNVGEAIELLKPWGVDVVSGVEASPGKKDPVKVRGFVRAVRDMDRRAG